MPEKPIITITTDFGEQDYFVGVMKGVILNINPEAVIVDINHQVNSFDVFDGAFTLAQSYLYFPSDTIHLVVVDPGVGSVRRPILIRTTNYKFVAPDNGVLSLIYEREERVEVRHVTADHYFLHPVSNTFHGRDIFAPVAAWLSRGVELEKFGEVITDYAKFTSPRPKREGENLVKGVAIKVDKFGNVITNIRPEDVPQLFAENPPRFRIVINKHEVTRLCSSYSMGEPSEIFAIVGSSGFLEIGANRKSAARILNVNRGAEVAVLLGNEAAAAS
ncbi:MAG: SAM-dependent chlorinase/fluorinase [Acidobacteria bacterium]|nr:SAM-dependent chlorinase/fluorinase [Acidobacteriota bacterium]